MYIVKGFTILFQKTIMHLPDSNLHISLDRLVFIIKSNVTLIQQCGIKINDIGCDILWRLLILVTLWYILKISSHDKQVFKKSYREQ